MIDNILETERLILTPLKETDLDFMTQMKTDPDVMKYTGGVLPHDTVVAGYSKKIEESAWDGETGEWIISLKDGRQPIGSVGIFELPESDDDQESVIMTGEIEIGYRSIVEAWGKGYITEAAKAVLEFAFENGDLPKIVACTDHENEASKNILRKIGLQDCGLRRCYGLDLPYFEITRTDWSRERENK